MSTTRIVTLHEILRHYYGHAVGVPVHLQMLAIYQRDDWLDSIIAAGGTEKEKWAQASIDSSDWLESIIARQEMARQERHQKWEKEYVARSQSAMNPNAAPFMPRLFGG